MRIAFAEIGQETDTFSPMSADLSDFEAYGLYYGAEMLTRCRGVGPLGGFLEVVAEQPVEPTLLPIMRAWGSAGGTITTDTLTKLCGDLLAGLRQSLPIDGVFLSLHGAASAENDDDVEGHILEQVRAVVGSHTPIVVAFDHHANVTRRMVQHATLLVGHETQPHDPPATGRKAARLLFRMLRGEIRPVVAWQKVPLITPQDQFLTSVGPMREWFELARQYEQQPRVLDVSPYPMQPWLDAAEGGWAVVVHTDGDEPLARQIAAEMSDAAWQRRERFWESERVSVAEAVRRAVAAERGLVILSDTGDSVYGGAPGDNTNILCELIAQRVMCPALVPMVDAAALAAAHQAGVGATITVELGGKVDRLFCQPVTVTGQVAALSQGFSVDLADRGLCDLRRTARLQVGGVQIALLDHRSFAINHPVLYSHLGIEVDAAKLVVLKTASNFQFFARWRSELIRVDSAGTTQSNLRAFDWKRIPRPTWPLDPLDEWHAPHRSR